MRKEITPMACRTFAALVVAAGLTNSSLAQITLTDATATSGLTCTHIPDFTCFGGVFWMTGGAVVGDFNNDDWPDIYWIGGGDTADKLFINDGDGTFTDQAVAWSLPMQAACAASTTDYDGDGLLDIYVSSFGQPGQPAATGMLRLFRNTGSSFVDVANTAGVNTASTDLPYTFGSAWGDYDLDGDLDLFVCTWKLSSLTIQPGNLLYRNNGDGTFTDVTATAIGTTVNDISGFQPAFIDMNDDLYPEILIAADFFTSRYLVNNGDGTFSDMTVASGTGLDSNGMGQTVGDFNNDGLFDWYVTSIHEAGNPLASGNMLYTQTAPHTFTEESMTTGTNDGGWGWGVVTGDFDNDGWLDIVEVNGSNHGIYQNERGYIWHNDGDGTFTEIGATSGFNQPGEGRALLWLDADRDGDLDLVVFNNDQDLKYYRNDTPKIGTWLHITLDTSGEATLAPNGWGAKVTATVAGSSQIRSMYGNPSYLGTSELAVHFGFGTETSVDELRIQWPDGRITVLEDVAVNQHLTIDVSNVIPLCVGDATGDGTVNVFDLLDLLAAWGTNPGHNADFDDSGAVDVFDLLDLISAWGDC